MKLFKVAASKVVEFVKFVVAAVVAILNGVVDMATDKVKAEVGKDGAKASYSSEDIVKGAAAISGLVLICGGVYMACKGSEKAAAASVTAGATMLLGAEVCRTRKEGEVFSEARDADTREKDHEARMADKEAAARQAEMDHEFRMKTGEQA